MPSVTFTNISGGDLFVSALYKSMVAGESITTSRSKSDLEDDNLQALVTTGKLTITVAHADADRQQVGPFTVTLAASQTNISLGYGGSGVGWVAPKAGSLVGFSASLSAAVTAADANCRLTKNGTPIAASQLDFTAVGAETKDFANFNKDATGFTFVAGDEIKVVYTSGAIGNTPVLVADFEVEM